MFAAPPLRALLTLFETAVPSLTLFRIAAAARVVGPPVDGVSALLVLQGTLAVEEVAGAAAGRLVLVPAGRPMLLAPAGEATGETFGALDCLTRHGWWLVADATRGRQAALVVAAGRIAGSGADELPAPVVLPLSRHATGRSLLTLLRAACDEGATGEPALAAALMNACAIEALRRADRTLPAPPPAERANAGSLIARAVAVIRARPTAAHSIDALAALAGMSRSSFTRHFRRALGVTPAGFVQAVRLEEARTTLVATALPISTVARRAGFAS